MWSVSPSLQCQTELLQEAPSQLETLYNWLGPRFRARWRARRWSGRSSRRRRNCRQLWRIQHVTWIWFWWEKSVLKIINENNKHVCYKRRVTIFTGMLHFQDGESCRREDWESSMESSSEDESFETKKGRRVTRSTKKSNRPKVDGIGRN